MSDFLKNVQAAAESTGKNQAETKSGGDFERTIYPEGPVRLRFISYVELGKHTKTWKGVAKDKDMVRLAFEVSGPKHAPVVGTDGVPHPLIVYIEEALSQDPKANWVKLFSLLNHDRSATHATQLLGRAYKGMLTHRKFKRKNDPAEQDKWTGLDYKLRGDNGYTIAAPFAENPETGDMVELKVSPPLTKLSALLWDAPSQEQWDSIFIPGEYPERTNEAGVVTAKARSKNVVQERVMKAVNFKGSPLHTLLLKAGVELNLDVEREPGEDDEAPSEDEAPPPKAAGKTPTKVASGKPSDDDFDIPF